VFFPFAKSKGKIMSLTQHGSQTAKKRKMKLTNIFGIEALPAIAKMIWKEEAQVLSRT